MDQTDLAVATSGRPAGRRRLRLGVLLAGLLGLALAAWWLLGHAVSAEARARADGYVSIGTQDGDTFWAKVSSPGELSILSTGRDGALCNATGPNVVGTMLCSGGVAGQAYIIVMVAPAGTAHVSLETSVGSRTLVSIGHPLGIDHVIAVGVFRGEQTMPSVTKRTYLSGAGRTLVE